VSVSGSPGDRHREPVARTHDDELTAAYRSPCGTNAVKALRLAINPAKGIENMPRKVARRHVCLAADDVHRLASEAGQHRALVPTLAFCGIRWGEAIALRVRDIEFLKRRLVVSENAVQLGVNDAVGTTKGRKARSVPVSTFVLDELSIQCRNKAAGDLVFSGPPVAICRGRSRRPDGSPERSVARRSRPSLRTTSDTRARRFRFQRV
jgi:integrase